MDVPEIQVCGSVTIQNAEKPRELCSMPFASTAPQQGEVVCFGSLKIQDTTTTMRGNEGDRKSARAVQKREATGPVKVTLNDPAVVVVGTILGPNPGEEKQIIYYDDK